MGNYLHRITKKYYHSTSPADLPEVVANYISMPDMSAVEGVPEKYLVTSGDIVSEMSQTEKDVVDAAALAARRDAAVDRMIDNPEGDFRQVVKLLMSEINILRAKLEFSNITIAQCKTKMRNGYGN